MDTVISAATSWRHRLHELAETAFDETETAAFIGDVLASLGLDVVTGLGGTGVVGTLHRGTSGKVIGLRADMDALPLPEKTSLTYSSHNPHTMHACGHDGHMAMVLGAAAALTADPDFHGMVRFLFQPAEEPGRGALAMLDDGLLQQLSMDAIFGLHNIPGLPAGHLATRAGAIMAGEDNFKIVINGRGGHASAPHLVVDPLVAAASIISALQTIVARTVDPLEAAVVSCTDIRTDGTRNAIPTAVVITGDTRSFTATGSTLIEHRMRELVTAVAAGHGAHATLEYTREFRPTVNNPAATAQAVDAALCIGPAAGVDAHCAPIMASEDFGRYADRIPANFTFIGNGATGAHGGIPLHSHDYQFNDAIIPIGIEYYTHLARTHCAI